MSSIFIRRRSLLIYISSEVCRKFTSLEVLDQEPITQISFDAPRPTSNVTVEKPSATSFPYPMGPSFVTGVDGSLVSNFLIRYLISHHPTFLANSSAVSSKYLILNVNRSCMFTTHPQPSPSPPTQLFRLVRVSQDFIPLATCQTNANSTGVPGSKLGRAISTA